MMVLNYSYKVPKSCCFTSGPWDLNLEKKLMQSFSKREIIFWYCLACAMNYTYNGWQFKS